ncbi:MAG: hypothetical protein ACRDKZ_11940 [Actinomycetota bacterium]
MLLRDDKEHLLVLMTGFRPDRDGFAFRNSWRFDDHERRVLRDLVHKASRSALRVAAPVGGTALDIAGVDEAVAKWASGAIPDSYGLCGGMAFAALDFFKSDAQIPRGDGPDDIPNRDTPEGAALRSYLWTRLIDSLEPNLATFLGWMAKLHLVPDVLFLDGGADALRDDSRKQWATLKRHLDKGEPWPIGLIGATRDPFNNHQVLACGYAMGSSRATIYVYDMNCPGRTNTIRINLEGDELAASGSESCAGKRGVLRGFFCERYSHKTPDLEV